MFFCEYCEIFKNSFFYITPMAAASWFLIKLAENNCKENHFSLERFSKTNSFTGFSQFLPFFKNPAKRQDVAFCAIS